jgi:hypothetical protein
MDKKTVYIETSIVSYLTARPTNDLLAAAWQKATIDWWEAQRTRFDLYTSDDAARRRLEALSGIPLLAITEPVVTLSKALLRDGALPSKAQDDALHMAVSAVHGVDYLLTWNCRHLDNAETKPIMRTVCSLQGHTSPEICTPQELMGVAEDV